ncbi:tRNA-(ms[2]io[6]A)-hydroxylase [bacterium]|nr:tRNA-(ms[2]io[6]A)-hydroxylase [bacterium]
MSRIDVTAVVSFLHVSTPDSWLESAGANLSVLLVDHANCEKKAASTALSMIYRYVNHPNLLHKMSRLAREELRHFEQVLTLMTDQGIKYVQLQASRYAGELHTLVSKHEPQRLVDLLILGAVVEARSCERFVKLTGVLPDPIAHLYRQLAQSEARHFMDYLDLAREFSNQDIDDRIRFFLDKEAHLITTPDPDFRFHSGVPS